MKTMHTKTLIGAAIALALLAGYRFANDNGIIGQSIDEERAAGQCYADAQGLFLRASSTDFASDADVVPAVFANLMGSYQKMSGCRQAHIADFRLASSTVATSTNRLIAADIVYDVRPGDLRDTSWTAAGARDGFWVRGIKANLQIYRTEDGFFLAI